MKSADYFCPVLTKLEFGRQILCTIPGIQCLETLSSGNRLCSMRTDRDGDSNSRLC
jgi:hypothetical protein